jgi:hypothetical protein
VPQAAITAYIHQALDVESDLRTKAAFNLVFGIDELAQFCQIFLRQVIYQRIGVYLRPLTDPASGRTPNTVNIRQRDINMLVREVNSRDTSHSVFPPTPGAVYAWGSRK